MNLDSYQATSQTFDIGAKRNIPPFIAVHALGLAGETGEVLEILKKAYRDGTNIDRAHLAEELGDVLWYLSQIASDFDLSLEMIAGANVAKLEGRRERDKQLATGSGR